MVDPGENRTATLIREFGEEALNSLEKTDEEKEKIKKMLTELFHEGDKVCCIYIVKILFHYQMYLLITNSLSV